LLNLLEALGQIGHIECAGHTVEQADADQQESGANGAHHQVLVGGHQGAALAVLADQDIARQRRDFEKHKQVEDIAGEGDAQQPGQRQQVGSVEACAVVCRHFGAHTQARIGNHHGANPGDNQCHQGVESIDTVFDTPGRLPAAEVIAQYALAVDLVQHQDRQSKHQPRHRSGQQPAPPGGQ